MSEATDGAPAGAPHPSPSPPLRRPQRGRNANAALEAIDIGRGVILHARPFRDSFASAEILAIVEREMDAVVSDDGAPEFDWGFDADRIERLRASEQLRMLIKGWMRSVIQALKTVERIEGLVEEDGVTPCAPSFDLFAALFESDVAEYKFRARALAIQKSWESEGKDSGSGQNMRSAAGSIIAPAAEQTTPPAPADSASSTSTESVRSALSSSTPPAPPPALSPGNSVTASAPGSVPVSVATSPDLIGPV